MEGSLCSTWDVLSHLGYPVCLGGVESINELEKGVVSC